MDQAKGQEMKKEHALAHAETLITGVRNTNYGPPEENFRRIAAGWSVIFGAPVTPRQVVLAMDWVKTARLVHSPDHEDSWIDKIGYSAIGAELEV